VQSYLESLFICGRNERAWGSRYVNGRGDRTEMGGPLGGDRCFRVLRDTQID
jgi:hypothetical protein